MISIILFISFLAISNVSAETLLNKYEHDVHIMNTYEMSDDEIRDLSNKIANSSELHYDLNSYIDDYINARNKLKSMFEGKDTKYILYNYAGQLYYKTISSNINPGLAIFNNDSGRFGINFGFNSETIGSQTAYKYNSSNNSFSSGGSYRMFGPQISINDMSTISYDIVDLFETNFHSDNMQYFLPVYGSNKYSGDITYNNQTYSINSYLPIDVYNGYNPINFGPKINISEIDSTYINVNSELEGQSFKTSATYNINFSIYDESIYNYYYSKDNENWIDIYNDYQLKVTENNRYYFKVTDKDNNIITSNSIDVTQLKPLDYVKVKLDVNDIIEVSKSFIDFTVILDNDDNLLSKPYIETFYNDDGRYIERRNQWNKEDERFTFALSQDLDTTVYYNYVLDLIDYSDSLNMSFCSNNGVGYEIVYYFKDGQVLTTGLNEYVSNYPENYNLVKLDLSSSSGIMILPKNWSTNDVFSNFYNGDIQHIGLFGIYLNGNFRIRNYTKNGLLRITQDSLNKGYYYGNAIQDIETNIAYPFPDDSGYLIIKQESKMGSRGDSTSDYIILDTYRYSYKIINSDSEVPSINHPNNDDLIIEGPTINESDLEDNILNSSSKNDDFDVGMFNITDFINDLSEHIEFVHEVFQDFYDSLPGMVKGLLILIFHILCINMILRIGGWLG